MEVNIKLIGSQQKFLSHMDDLEYAFLAGVGTGKSFVGAFWTFYRTYYLKEKIFVGSQQWSTTRDVQFKAIVDLMDMCNIKEGVDYSYDKSRLRIEFDKGGIIKGIASSARDSVTGYTKFHGAWFDEAYLWDKEQKNYVMGRCRNCYDSEGNLVDARFRYTGTPPLEPSGWYYEWLLKHPDLYVQASTEESIGKYNAPSYLEQQIDAYGGRESPLCRIQVFGELPSPEASSSVFKREHSPRLIPMAMGVDCSGGNNGDACIFIVTDGIKIYDTVELKNFKQSELYAKADELISTYKVKLTRTDNTGGYGIGLTEHLKDGGNMVEGINFGQQARDGKSYVNARAEMYFNLASVWNDAWGELYRLERYATGTTMSSNGKLQIIAKENIKKVIGHSPDGLDALALALYDDGKEIITLDTYRESLDCLRF